MAERVRVAFDTDLRRPRRGVFLRVLLAVPVLLALVLMTAAAAVALVSAWPAAVVRGELPHRLHRLGCRYIRDAVRLAAWLTLVVGVVRAVTIDAPRSPQRRDAVALRPLLALPSVVLASVLAVALAWTGAGAWFVALARGRTTEGLRELGAFCLRYHAETLAYLLLVSPAAPRLAPPVRGAP